MSAAENLASKTWMTTQYVTNHKSPSQIAAEQKVPVAQVVAALEGHGITLRKTLRPARHV